MSEEVLEKVNKLKEADKIAFNLEQVEDKKLALRQLGQVLNEAGLVQVGAAEAEIITVYQQNVEQRLQDYLKSTHEEADKLVLNEAVLAHYQKADSEDAELVQSYKENLITYSLIVLTFANEVNALRASKNGSEYREAFERLDRHRTNVHDACLFDIKVINQMALQDGVGQFVVTELTKPNRTDYGAAIVKLCYRGMVAQLKD
ncbi:DUF3232 domain-containing protein [Lactobacillus sp. PV034]|uniref:DUF3232 domain-containing protein n=1 Tax=Lactobacillus sp. PV034 TaxID=2594495 RepID=UPI00223FDBB7|nr:DUF3232 domain-containing protein [Lactobacillus sp. PV034]QNQ80204.1 DUF3232 domain-containing protein [Lactobacillus sp. PV034]